MTRLSLASGDDLFGDDLKLVDLEDALDLGPEAGEEPEVSATHSDQRGDHVMTRVVAALIWIVIVLTDPYREI